MRGGLGLGAEAGAGAGVEAGGWASPEELSAEGGQTGPSSSSVLARCVGDRRQSAH